MFAILNNTLVESGSVTFEVKVHAGAHKTKAKEMLDNGVYKIDVAAVREDGKANAELVDFLADAFGVAKAHVEILSGHTSGQKRIKISL
ncbi:MAG TPA: DUF167 domain-containing protein [Candidatus Peribacteria bacterium]|nr:DUF167 domain-containing protein [Candidatus Peribacteria bacterium]